MPKLNLDIFSPEPETKKQPRATSTKPKQSTPPRATRVEKEKEDKPIQTDEKARHPKFVPVGFYPKHLRLLDEAVLKLRQQGHWKASKSAIIRKLIDLHAARLDKVYHRQVRPEERSEGV